MKFETYIDKLLNFKYDKGKVFRIHRLADREHRMCLQKSLSCRYRIFMPNIRKICFCQKHFICLRDTYFYPEPNCWTHSSPSFIHLIKRYAFSCTKLQIFRDKFSTVKSKKGISTKTLFFVFSQVLVLWNILLQMMHLIASHCKISRYMIVRSFIPDILLWGMKHL